PGRGSRAWAPLRYSLWERGTRSAPRNASALPGPDAGVTRAVARLLTRIPAHRRPAPPERACREEKASANRDCGPAPRRKRPAIPRLPRGEETSRGRATGSRPWSTAGVRFRYLESRGPGFVRLPRWQQWKSPARSAQARQDGGCAGRAATRSACRNKFLRG